MVTVACSLLLFSTAHFVIDIIRIMQGLILYRDSYPGGPIKFFSDVSQWTLVCKTYIYVIQTLIGDGVMLYRCYAVWQSGVIMILPGLLWCSVAVTGFGAPYSGSQVSQDTVFGGNLVQWMTAFYASTFTTNLLVTILLAYRIWYIDRKATKLRVHCQSQLRPILDVIIDAGAIYSLTLLAALVCFANQSNGQCVILHMIMAIISITFYMVIIRVGLANRTRQRLNAIPLEYSDADGTRRMQVHITTLTETKVDWTDECCG
ncbi:hypothetical protein JVU11DRAFT_6150 [Chiua virens]|nr:hypothetical protein JVU11DRAFT_6150 [Chiua virens]